MKNIIAKIILVSLVALLFISCEIDNFEGPDATFYGAIKDSLTNELVGTDLQNGSAIEAFELGYPTQVMQKWVINNTG